VILVTDFQNHFDAGTIDWYLPSSSAMVNIDDVRTFGSDMIQHTR
jgi:predicted hotdog family 3-hydroxylacyl-ACP dehydratase